MLALLLTPGTQHAPRESSSTSNSLVDMPPVATLGILPSSWKALLRSNIWWMWVVFLCDLFIFSTFLPFVLEDIQCAYSLPKQCSFYLNHAPLHPPTPSPVLSLTHRDSLSTLPPSCEEERVLVSVRRRESHLPVGLES